MQRGSAIGVPPMSMLLTFARWLCLRNQDPMLLREQHRELRRQVPLLYALLSVNALALSYTHVAFAPFWATVLLPGGLVAASMVRMIAWLWSTSDDMSPARILHKLRMTTVMAAILSVVYVAWALQMTRYGGTEEDAHVAIFIAITVIGCIFCLIHLPQAALCVLVIVTAPYLAYYLSSGSNVYVAIALNIFLVSLVVVRVLLNGFSAFSGLVHSRSEMDRLHHQMSILAHNDTLTVLPNRRAFFAELDRMQEAQRAEDGNLALGMIDLDRFKAANDTFGHLVGDRLLEAVGQRLRERCPHSGLVARLGGDEFAVLIPGRAVEAMRIAEELCVKLSEPYRIGELTITIGASCGVATMDDRGDAASSLYERADYALYHGKENRRGLATLYSPEFERGRTAERAIESALRSCDVDAEMDVHLQPIFDVATGRISSVEALARWTHPKLGPVRPDVFIPLAERCGITHYLTTRLFAKALAYAARIPSDIRLSFNLSAHDVISRETILALVSAIRTSGLPPSRIVFELTETAVVRDFALARESLGLLHALGTHIALDDFGTGQSNLGHLHELPMDKIKIDRSFVSGPRADDRRRLLAAIVALGHSLRLRCVAEGVEDAEQLAHLREIGCDAFQGYYGAMPMPLEDFLNLVSARSNSSLCRA